MLSTTYYTEFTAPSEQRVTTAAWWQELFNLGREAIRRAFPLPGEAAGGLAVPPPPAPAAASIAGVPLWAAAAFAVALILAVRR